MMKRLWRALGKILICFGIILFFLSMPSYFVWPVADDVYSEFTNKVPGYHYRTIDFKGAKYQIDKIASAPLDDESKLRFALDVVFASFFHAPDNYYIRITDNWIMWAVDRYAKMQLGPNNFLPIMDAEFLWARGGGWCGQAVQIFSKVANDLGFKTRTWWNRDHVMGEVFIPNRGWILFDADYGIWWGKSFSDLAHEDREKIEERFVGVLNSEKTAKSLVNLYFSPPTPWSLDSVDRSFLVQFESISNILVKVLPLLLCIFGYVCIKGAKFTVRQSLAESRKEVYEKK